MGEKLDDTAFRDIPCRMNRHDACFSSLSTLPASSLYKLLEKLWDVDENYVDEHALTTTISRIRSKIETNQHSYIKTVYGMGYMWIGGAQK